MLNKDIQHNTYVKKGTDLCPYPVKKKKKSLYVSTTFGTLKSNVLAVNLNPFVQVLTVSSSLATIIKLLLNQIKLLVNHFLVNMNVLPSYSNMNNLHSLCHIKRLKFLKWCPSQNGLVSVFAV